MGSGGGGGVHTSLRVRGWKAALQWHLVLRVVLLPFDVTLCRNRRWHKENDIVRASPQFRESGEEVPPSPLLFSPHRWTGRWRPPHSTPSPIMILFTEKKVQLSIFTCAPRNSSSRSRILLSHQFAYPIHFTLKAPYCIYIMIIPDLFFFCFVFFTVDVFVLHPILFGSLLVALMWNVCAEPIECCVYIKATLFLTTPAFVVWVWLCCQRQRRVAEKKNCTIHAVVLSTGV